MTGMFVLPVIEGFSNAHFHVKNSRVDFFTQALTELPLNLWGWRGLGSFPE